MRALLQPFAHLYWRLSRIGREHIPESGPVILASNHRSFLDPFIIGLTARRPVYYVAKEELFRNRLFAWFLNSLGAFPVRRGAADADMIETARAILERGDPVLIFPEGSRNRRAGELLAQGMPAAEIGAALGPRRLTWQSHASPAASLPGGAGDHRIGTSTRGRAHGLVHQR